MVIYCPMVCYGLPWRGTPPTGLGEGARRGAWGAAARTALATAAAVGPREGGIPHPKILSSINNKNNQRNPKSEKIQKTKTRLVFHHEVSLFDQKVKMILWSIHTFWYKVRPKTKENYKFEKRTLPLKKKTAQTRRLIFPNKSKSQ